MFVPTAQPIDSVVMYNIHTIRFIKSQYTLFIFGVNTMTNRKAIIASLTIITTLLLSFYLLEPALSPLQSRNTVSSRGGIKTIGVGVYSDLACTNRLSSIDWGLLEPGTGKNFTCYVRNEGRATVTLTQSTTNWNPSNTSQYITLSWNYAGRSIAVNEVLKVTFTLTVSASISGITDFSFEIVIIGTG